MAHAANPNSSAKHDQNLVQHLQRIVDAESNLTELANQVDSKDKLKAALTTLSISCSSPRFHSACWRFDAGYSAQEVLREAVEHERNARNLWVSTSLAPWCDRHGISLLQGLSIVFDDDAYNPCNPMKDRVTRESLFWNGQQNNFAPRVRIELIAALATPDESVNTGEVTDVHRFFELPNAECRNDNISNPNAELVGQLALDIRAGEDEGVLDELVHEACAAAGSDINNGGLAVQIAYLLGAGYSEVSIRQVAG